MQHRAIYRMKHKISRRISCKTLRLALRSALHVALLGLTFSMFSGLLTGTSTPVFAQQLKGQGGKAGAEETLYFHPYKPALNGSFQLQPEQAYAIVEPFGGFVRMVQLCVRDAKAKAAMPVPTPMLATRTKRGDQVTVGAVSVGSCILLEGEGISVGLVDGPVNTSVKTDPSNAKARAMLAYMAGSYTILGYYNTVPPVVPDSKDD